MKYESENEKERSTGFNQDDSPITIGRNDQKITIKDNSISKNHGVIVFSAHCQKFYYKDLGSTNGSILIMKEDDVIKIKAEMKFKLEDVPFRILELP